MLLSTRDPSPTPRPNDPSRSIRTCRQAAHILLQRTGTAERGQVDLRGRRVVAPCGTTLTTPGRLSWATPTTRTAHTQTTSHHNWPEPSPSSMLVCLGASATVGGVIRAWLRALAMCTPLGPRKGEQPADREPTPGGPDIIFVASAGLDRVRTHVGRVRDATSSLF